MKYRRMGQSGLKVSELSLGGWCIDRCQFDHTELSHLLSEAFERGVNFIDLADIYGRGEVEERFGRLLKNYPRHHLVLSTKSYWPMSQGVNDCGLSRKHIYESIHSSLTRLQTDYLDLFYCHRFDEDTPLVETIRAIGDFIKQGKIIYWGVCGWSEEQLRTTFDLCDRLNVPPPISQMLLYNLIERGAERQPLSVANELGLGVVSWSPLAGGTLAKPINMHNMLNIDSQQERKLQSEEAWINPWCRVLTEHRAQSNIQPSATQTQHSHHQIALERFKLLAEQHQMKNAQLALAWVLRRSEISSVVMEVSSVEQLRDNLETTHQMLPDELWRTLDDIFEL